MMEEKEIKRLIQEGRNFMKHPKWDESYQSEKEMKKVQPPLAKEKVSDEIYSLSKDFKEKHADILDKFHNMKNLSVSELKEE